MPDIKISVKNKIANQTDGTIYVCGNSDYRLLFDFDQEWDEYDMKTARFTRKNGYEDVIFSGNECAVPIISDTYCFYVGVYAGDLHTTTPARVACKKSVLCGSGLPIDPTPDVYAQIMALLNKLEALTDDQVADAVTAYLEENPVRGIEDITITEV